MESKDDITHGLFKSNNTKLSKFASGVQTPIQLTPHKPSKFKKHHLPPVSPSHSIPEKSFDSSQPQDVKDSSERKDSDSGRSVMILKEEMNDQISNLIEQNEHTNLNKKECMMCFQQEPNTIFRPCGHGGICFECSLEIMRNGNIECHYCRGVDWCYSANRKSVED